MKKYSFTYTEYFNNKEIVETNWESDTDADFYTMSEYLNRLASLLKEGGIEVIPLDRGFKVGKFGSKSCGFVAATGVPSEGDTNRKELVMTYLNED